MIFSKWAREISKILLILGSYNFLAYLQCVRSYAWSKGHSDPDLGSVYLAFKNGVKIMQTAGYNGACTVYSIFEYSTKLAST